MTPARKSVSPKQLAANRANASKSTGPRAIEEIESLKDLKQELPDEPTRDPQPEPKATTCIP
jgi:hypothetical protein